MKQWKELNERTKKGRAKGLEIGVNNNSRTPGPSFADIENTFGTKRKLGDRSNVSDRSNSDSDRSKNRESMVVSPSPVKVSNIRDDIFAEEVNIPTVLAQKLEDIPVDYARHINKEGNKEFVQENVEQIINAKDLLEGEKGKAKDILPTETFNAIKDNFKFLKVGANTTSETLHQSLNTIIQADLMQQGQKSPFKPYVSGKGGLRKKMKKEEDGIQEEKDNKPRSHRGQVNPKKMI